MKNNQSYEEKAKEYYAEVSDVYPLCKDIVVAHIAGAESRQPEIDRLSQHIVELQSEKGKLVDENKEARTLLREICANRLMITCKNPYADEKTNKMLNFFLGDWFRRAEQFLGE